MWQNTMKHDDLPKFMFCVYMIRNNNNRKIYIGKTKRPMSRFRQYETAYKTKNKKHINDYLLNAFIKHGFDNFNFSILEKCENEIHVSERELHWIKCLKTTDSKFGYNLRIDSKTGMTTHPNTSEKISLRLKKEWELGIRQNHSQKLKNNWQSDKNRRIEQSILFSKLKTKYVYIVTGENFKIECNYPLLRSLKLSNVISNFHRQKTNVVEHKGFLIERKLINA